MYVAVLSNPSDHLLAHFPSSSLAQAMASSSAAGSSHDTYQAEFWSDPGWEGNLGAARPQEIEVKDDWDETEGPDKSM